MKDRRVLRPRFWLMITALSVLVLLAAFGAGFGLFVTDGRAARRDAIDMGTPVTLRVPAGATRAVGVAYPLDVEPDLADPFAVRIVGPDGDPVAFDAGVTAWGKTGGDQLVELGTFTAPEAGDYEIALRLPPNATAIRLWSPAHINDPAFAVGVGATIVALVSVTMAAALAMRRLLRRPRRGPPAEAPDPLGA